jgi:pimeloyl-ACP methyl ester carboxylesterase
MSHRYSERLRRELEHRGPVLSLDLPGFGGRPRPPGARWSVEDYAHHLAIVLDEHDLRDAVLIGHSMGAQFAVALAGNRPDLVSRLVLVGAVVDPDRRTALQQMFDLLRDLVTEPPAAIATVTGDYLRTGARWFFAELRAMLAYRTEEALVHVRCPVLVARGENDPIARREWCEALAAHADDGSLVEFPGGGHVVQHTRPAAVARAITRFAMTDVPESRR